MNIQSILFATDFSEYNEAALEYASTLAAESGATLHIVHVHDMRGLSTASGEASYYFATDWHEEFDKAHDRLARIRPTVPGVTYEHHCLLGPPEDEIVNFAAARKVDLIVMASHGRSGLSRLLLGSVAEAVMRKASCPVLVVKQPAPNDNSTQHSAASGANLGIIS